MVVLKDEDVGLAFACVFAAGASTCLGAAIVFFPSLVKLSSRRVLAAGLAFAAGVMVYVSFLDIFAKSMDSFLATNDEPMAYLYATLCFFAGVVLMMLLELIEKHFFAGAIEDLEIENFNNEEPNATTAFSTTKPPSISSSSAASTKSNSDDEKNHFSDEEGHHGLEQQLSADEEAPTNNPSFDGSEADDCNEDSSITKRKSLGNKQELNKLGIKTAVAIALHNFPEGIATFVAYLADPKVGISLAIAIAFHNIPEGLCVALPIYYATGSRCRGFGMACVSALSEPLGALMGWLVLVSVVQEEVYGVLFGIVGGMMVVISVGELLPTALKCDPGNQVTLKAFIFGMFFMSISLVLLQF